MKTLRILFPLLLAVTLLTAATAVADQPGTNEDPFGGLALISEKFGTNGIIPGGVPSRHSGDGTTPRKAIYIGGVWGVSGGERPIELPNCALMTIPAGHYRWFKLDAFGDRYVRIWVDDKSDQATASADDYMLGTTPVSLWQRNAIDRSQTNNYIDGFAMSVYDPDNLKPMWYFAPPNAAILSVDTNDKGELLNGPTNISIEDATGAGVHGYGSYNPNEPNHLLWYEGHFDGWAFVSVYNQMTWSGTASVCSQRVY